MVFSKDHLGQGDEGNQEPKRTAKNLADTGCQHDASSEPQGTELFELGERTRNKLRKDLRDGDPDIWQALGKALCAGDVDACWVLDDALRDGDCNARQILAEALKMNDTIAHRIVVNALREGDENALETLHTAWLGLVRGIIRHKIGNRPDVNDLAQEVFLAIWLKRESLDPERSVRALLVTLAARKASKWYGGQFKQKFTSLNNLKFQGMVAGDDEAYDDLCDLIRIFIAREGLKKLTKNERRIVKAIRKTPRGATRKEIAAKAGMKERAINTAICLTFRERHRSIFDELFFDERGGLV